jgi:hypothetical protein
MALENPALNERSFQRGIEEAGVEPRAMTAAGTYAITGLLFVIVVAAAAFGWSQVEIVTVGGREEALTPTWTWLACLVTFIVAIVVAEFRSAFPDFHDSIDIQVAEGELVVTRFTSMGTHRGTFMGVEPTNKELVWTGITIDRVSGGRIVESWANWDMMGLMQQLGAISSSGEISEEASPT